MNILFIAANTPYSSVGHAGGQTLNYYLSKMEKYKDNNISLVSFCQKEEAEKAEGDYPNVEKHLIVRNYGMKNKIRNILSINSKINPWHRYANIMTWNAANLLIKELKKMKKNGADPDVIVLEWTQILVIINEIKRVFPNAKIVASEHDVTFLGFERKAEAKTGLARCYKNIQYHNMKKRELKALNQCNLVITHNKKDKDLLLANSIPKERLFALVPFYHQSTGEYLRQNNDIVFFGYMKRIENILGAKWFVDNVMPLVEDLDIRFVIMGGGVTDEISSLRSDKIIVTGFVEDIDSVFLHSMCFVSPLTLGAGIKVKVLEAMHTGIPVLTNNIGIEGIEAMDGEDYFHCEKPEDYEKVIRSIYEKITTVNGRNIILHNFNLEESSKEYYERINSLIKVN